MRKLKSNEKIIKEYDRYILIEVACPHGNSCGQVRIRQKWKRQIHVIINI